MIRRLRIKNFLSYKGVDLNNLDGAEAVAIVGDNGHGKSALLEAVPFALFGSGRFPVADLVREHSNGEMRVALELSDIPYAGDVLVVDRQYAGGKSKASVKLNDEVVANGSTSVQKYLTDELHITDTTFMLTTFFGFSASDRLLQVRASERLETIQDIARVSFFKALHKQATSKKNETEKEITSVESAIEVYDNLLSDVDDTPPEKLAEVKSKIEADEEALSRKVALKAKMLGHIEREKVLLAEQSKLQQEHKTLMQNRETYGADLLDLEDSITNEKLSRKKMATSITALKKSGGR